MNLGVSVIGRICALALGAWITAPALASSDMGCEPSLALEFGSFTGCAGNATLSPGNDTRANLILLMRDVAATSAPLAGNPVDPVFSWSTLEMALNPPRVDADDATGSLFAGSADRCNSDAQGVEDLTRALSANTRVPDPEKQALLKARAWLGCSADDVGDAAVLLASISSSAGKQFADYVYGAAAFYAGDFESAAEYFADLRRASDPWVREAARYMQARVALNAAQADGFDEYGAQRGPEHFQQAALALAEQEFKDYLHSYPQGRYAASARGLIRRVYWLGGDTGKLEHEYDRLMRMSAAERGLSDIELAQEIDHKLLAADLDLATLSSPMLLAVADLRAMRRDGGDAALSLEALQAQRPRFASEPALFSLLMATARHYVADAPAQALTVLDEGALASARGSVAFSAAMLRGLAADATGTPLPASYWRALLADAEPVLQRPLVQLALALRLERDGSLDEIFAPGSPIVSQALRDRLLVRAAGPEQLRRQALSGLATAHERGLAAFLLLYKQLSRGRPQAFLDDRHLLAEVPDEASGDAWVTYQPAPVTVFHADASVPGAMCPGLGQIARTLAGQADDARAALCLADFFRENGFDHTWIDRPLPASELGGAPSQFAGERYARQAVYQRVIDDAKAPADDQAYALYRAVYCYAPSGSNDCGGADVPKAQRKRWFQRLKTQFPSSSWARDLKYYW